MRRQPSRIPSFAQSLQWLQAFSVVSPLSFRPCEPAPFQLTNLIDYFIRIQPATLQKPPCRHLAAPEC